MTHWNEVSVDVIRALIAGHPLQLHPWVVDCSHNVRNEISWEMQVTNTKKKKSDSVFIRLLLLYSSDEATWSHTHSNSPYDTSVILKTKIFVLQDSLNLNHLGLEERSNKKTSAVSYKAGCWCICSCPCCCPSLLMPVDVWETTPWFPGKFNGPVQ